jgi:hypothetical protein
VVSTSSGVPTGSVPTCSRITRDAITAAEISRSPYARASSPAETAAHCAISSSATTDLAVPRDTSGQSCPTTARHERWGGSCDTIATINNIGAACGTNTATGG